jgi:hypothetical protein
VAWEIRNNSGSRITIESLNLDWPASNDALFNVFLNGTMIWGGEDLDPPTSISSWIGGSGAREVNTSADLEFAFGASAAGSGYNLRVNFDNGCQVSSVN